MDSNNDFLFYYELQPGTKLNGGKYVIEGKISTGGFGITYRATQTALNRTVCIKEYFLSGFCVRDTGRMTVMPQADNNALFEKYRKAFVNEAQTLASLHHSSIVEVIDIFDENNTSYMVMPFIEGQSLQNIVENNGPLDFATAYNYIAQISDAIAYLHGRKILHRDIKPDNIMITNDLRAILIDFGSAREFVNDKTQAQTSMLTHGYAPTEQYSKNSRKGNYTDIYALGATLYFILTGRKPTDAAARITEPMPEPREIVPTIPENANRTILKAMQMQAKDRHQTIAEFMADLNDVTQSQATYSTTNVNPSATLINDTTIFNTANKPTDKKKHKKKLWIIIPITIVVLAALGVGSMFLFNQTQKKDPLRKLEKAPRYYVTGWSTTNMYPTTDFSNKKNYIRKYQYGTELLVLDSVPGNYFHCVYAPRDASGKIIKDECVEGYIPYRYMMTKPDFYLMNSIFGNENANAMFDSIRYRIAILDYYKKQHYKGNLTDSEIEKYGIDKSYKNAERWQVFCEHPDSLFNNVYRSSKYNRYHKLNIAVIIKNLDTYERKLLFFTFDQNENPSLLFEQPMPREGYIKNRTLKLERNFNGNYYATYELKYD